jgi:uridine kinase
LGLINGKMLPELSVQHFLFMDTNTDILVSRIIERFMEHNSNEAFTVAVSGIDAAGKGYISSLMKEALEEKGYKVALINADPWQNPIPVRLKNESPAENFYEHVFRWNDLFERLIIPLKTYKSIYLETMGIRTDADAYFPLL